MCVCVCLRHSCIHTPYLFCATPFERQVINPFLHCKVFHCHLFKPHSRHLITTRLFYIDHSLKKDFIYLIELIISSKKFWVWVYVCKCRYNFGILIIYPSNVYQKGVIYLVLLGLVVYLIASYIVV